MKQGRPDYRYILISENLSNIVEIFSIKSGYRSYHSVIVMELKFTPFIRGHGLFKFNNSSLYDDVYDAKVKHTIQEVIKNIENIQQNMPTISTPLKLLMTVYLKSS